MSGVTLSRFSPGTFDVPEPLADEPKGGRTTQTQETFARGDTRFVADSSERNAASAMGRKLDSQFGRGTEVATVTLDGQFQVGVDFFRGIGPGEFGYIAVDVISAGQTGFKFLQNKKLTADDEVPMRLHVEAGLRGIRNIPQIGPTLADEIAKKYPKLQQGQIGAAADIVVSGRRDGKPGVEIKKFDVVVYVNVPPPPGEVSIQNGKVSAGGLDKNLSNISFGINYTAGKGWSWVPPALLHGKITNLAIPPEATPVNGNKSFFDGFGLIGVTGPNDDGATTGRNVVVNAVSSLSPTGDSRGSKIASGAALAANLTAFLDATGRALQGEKKIVDGAPEKLVGVGLVAGVFKRPGPRVPGEPALLVRGLMTLTSERDGEQTINVMYAGKLLFKTSLPQIQAAGNQVVEELGKLPGIGSLFKRQPESVPNVVSPPVYQEPLSKPQPRIDQVEKVTLNGKTFNNVQALPGASTQMPGQARISVGDFYSKILGSEYSGSRLETEKAYLLLYQLPVTPQRDRMMAKLMTDYMNGSTKTVLGIINGVLKGKPLTASQGITLMDVNNLLIFTNQVRAAAGLAPMTITNLSAWAEYARTGKPPAPR
jgi:hypothetical protein